MVWRAKPEHKEATRSDNLRRSRALRDALLQGYPGKLHGPVARHVTPLAALLSGIVGSTSPQLPHSATKGPDGTPSESRVTRLARWVDHARSTEEGYLVPDAAVVLAHLAWHRLGLVSDGSVGGRGGVALMLQVVSQGRALPLAGLGRQGTPGHVPADLPSARVKQGQKRVPPGAQVVVLGDGACDGTTLQHTVQADGWSSGVRTGSTLTSRWDGDSCRCETVGAGIKPGTRVERRAGRGTAAAYGPVRLLWCWAQGSKDPRSVVTHRATADEAWRLYATRCRIAPFVSDQTSRGFPLHQAPLSDPTRLARFLMAACFASLWIIHLGALCKQDGRVRMIPRGDRWDLSVFQLGLRLLDSLLHEDSTIPVAFSVSI